MKKDILFIINPKSGAGKGIAIEKKILSARMDSFNLSTVLTEYRGHATELAADAAKKNISCVVAVGGDGTVNEVASALNGSETALSIIPAGSGNGLARHLHFSTDVNKAIATIKNGTVKSIDTLRINDRFSVNVSGFGFDGYVAWLFDRHGKRGLSSYTKIALKEYFRYPAVNFNIKADEKLIDTTAHMVVIANASQFGNAAVIAPQADLNDGLMDIIIIKRPPFYLIPSTFYRLFNGSLQSNDYTQMLQCSRLTVHASRPVHLHIDGEPHEPLQEIIVSMNRATLKILN